MRTRKKHRRRRTVVVDTNVVVDALALYNVPAAGDEDFALEKQGWAWLLFMKLHRKSLTSFSLHEVREIVPRVVDRDDPAELRLAQSFLWLAKDELLPRWKWKCVDNYTHSTGGPADDDYLRLAATERLPLITNEDWTSSGIRQPPKKGSLRQRALDAGVSVFTAREYVERAKFASASAAAAFFEGWKQRTMFAVVTDAGVELPRDELEHVRGLIHAAVDRALAQSR